MCCVLQSQMHGRGDPTAQYSPDNKDEDEDKDMDTSSDQALEKPFHYCNTISIFINGWFDYQRHFYQCNCSYVFVISYY